MPTPEQLDWADVIVGRQLAYPGIAPHWQRWRAFAPTVYETDDDVFQLDPSNPALVVFLHPGVEQSLRRMLESSSLVTVTTGRLAERVGEYAERVVVLPNCLDESVLALPDPPPADGTVRIGWTASTSHYRDLYYHARALRRFFHATPAARFCLTGYDFRGLLALPHEQVEYRVWQPLETTYYPSIDFHVGIAPLAPSPFNESKSPIKALEYAARGIPCVASAGPAYSSFIEHGVTGFLVEQPDQWGMYLRQLVEDDQLRKEMGAAARKKAALFTIQGNAWRWEEAYRSLL